jgi:hypothetical protein
MEVFNAEMHAAVEALQTLRDLSLTRRQVFTCIDNSATVQILASNPDNPEVGLTNW